MSDQVSDADLFTQFFRRVDERALEELRILGLMRHSIPEHDLVGEAR
jgi:hypothetical protein